jgi:hypothetical protein
MTNSNETARHAGKCKKARLIGQVSVTLSPARLENCTKHLRQFLPNIYMAFATSTADPIAY